MNAENRSDGDEAGDDLEDLSEMSIFLPRSTPDAEEVPANGAAGRAVGAGVDPDLEVGVDLDGEPIPVGVADFAVTDRPRPLTTSGVGSCLAVAIYDESAGVSGLVHVMLPNAAESNARRRNDAKFADTGIARLVAELEALGGRPTRAKAKAAGGAEMIEFSQSDRSIGERNVEAVRAALAEHGVDVVAEDYGGSVGRSIVFDPERSELLVKTGRNDEKVL